MYPLAMHQKLTARPSMNSVPNITAYPSSTVYKCLRICKHDITYKAGSTQRIAAPPEKD